MKKFIREWLAAALAPELYRDAMIQRAVRDAKKSVQRRRQGARLPAMPVGEIQQEVSYEQAAPRFV